MQTRDKPRLLKGRDFCMSHQSGLAVSPHIQNIFHFRVIAFSESWACSPPFHLNTRTGALCPLRSWQGQQGKTEPIQLLRWLSPALGPAQHHSSKWQELEQSLYGARGTERLWPHTKRFPKDFPRNCLHKEGQKCACPEQIEKKPACLLFTQQYKWESWLGWVSNSCAC